MKKILLFLLLSIATYGQVSTGMEQEFDYGIKNNAAQEITTPTYIGTLGTDGTNGKIPSAYIEKTDNKQNSLTTDGTGVKYVTVDAVNDGLDTKLSSGNIVFETTGIFSNIQTLINSSPIGGTIYLKQNTTYTQTDELILKDKMTINGNGSTLKRGNQSSTTITTSVTNTSTSIQVASIPSDWLVGDYLQVYSDDSYLTSNTVTNCRILSISGLTINLNGNVGLDATQGVRVWAIGSNVRKVYSQILVPENLAVIIDNLNLDGNKVNNTGNYYWGVNSCISGYGASKINNCKFNEMPNECIIGSGFTITKCYGKNLNGSFMHQSTENTSTDLSRYYAEISNNLIDTSNIEYVKSGHSEGVITFSATAGRSNIHNNFFFNGSMSVLGFTSAGDGTDGGTRDFVFVNNFCRNFLKPIFATYGNIALNKAGKIYISENIFDNCGTFTTSSLLSLYDETYLGGNQLWGGTIFSGVPSDNLKIQDFSVDNIKSNLNIVGSLTSKNITLEDLAPFVAIKSTQGTSNVFKLWSSYNVSNDLVLRNETDNQNIFNFLKTGKGYFYNDIEINGKLGIGITPTSKFHILTGSVDGLRVQSSGSGYLEVGKTSGTRWRWANDYNVTDGFELLYGSSGSTPSSSRILVNTSGNINLGAITDDGINKLQVNGSTKTTALTLSTAPTTSASTYDILTRNSSTGVVEKVASSSALLWTDTAGTIRNNNSGAIELKPTGNISILNAANVENAKITSIGSFISKTTSTGFFGTDEGSGMYFDGSNLNFRNYGNSVFRFNPIYLNWTDGRTQDVIGFSNSTINPTSGTATFNMLNISPTVNQTGGANGITRSLYINPTLTAAVDFRAIEVTGGNSIFQKVIAQNTIRLKNYTVATLPTGTQGDTAYVTDALAPTYLVTVVGGGTVVCPVFYNGTNWISH